MGAGPAGACVALGALAVEPSLSVVLLDREDFPRDKACGDGIAPHVLDLLADVGITGILDDWTPVRRLSLERGDQLVDREMQRATWVVPRTVFDQRLVDAAVSAGAQLVRHRVRELTVQPDSVLLDESVAAKVVVGADGANSVVRRAVGGRPSPAALALRGYAPTPQGRDARQVIVYGEGRQPSYAWSFDRGDGLSNVGYGEALHPKRPHPTRADLLAKLERLLPGSTVGGDSWRAHHLPLSGWFWRPRSGRVLLAGDAAGLINPMTGEGIYYAVATGLLAGRAAVAALRSGDGAGAGAAYRRAVRLLGRHFRHATLAGRLSGSERVLSAGIRAAAADQAVFDDLVTLGLADGHITSTVLRSLFRRS
ncbi:geranylgeranyl reductase family protein [Kribbella sp. VKM Ac-2527]|uniref:Geranylgeranyl reductase family protein n=1 Tax=Kribbella caucasensis TaxID=2512215 RepID=A0A4R6KEG8_9ACTN|nr:geranylgeranyl reductase family protein [Kribbella sp. VKM Ac-2527]